MACGFRPAPRENPLRQQLRRQNKTNLRLMFIRTSVSLVFQSIAVGMFATAYLLYAEHPLAPKKFPLNSKAYSMA